MKTIVDFFTENSSIYLGYCLVGYVIIFFFLSIKKIDRRNSVWSNIGMFIFLMVFIASIYFLIKYFGVVKLNDGEQGALAIIAIGYLVLSYWVTKGLYDDIF